MLFNIYYYYTVQKNEIDSRLEQIREGCEAEACNQSMTGTEYLCHSQC